MTETVNKTYDNTDSLFTYTPGPSTQCWAQLSSVSSVYGYFNNTEAAAVQSGCNPSFTFIFPEPAITFYYYGRFVSPNEHFVWIDKDPTPDNHETDQFTGDNTGQTSTLLYVKRFGQPERHNITIGGPNPSLLSVDSVVLEVPSANGSAPLSASSNESNTVSLTSATPSGTTLPNGTNAVSSTPVLIITSSNGTNTVFSTQTLTITSSSKTITNSSTPTPKSGTGTTSTPSVDSGQKKVPYGAVMGGIIGGAALLLFIFAMWVRHRRKQNTASQRSTETTPFAAIMSEAHATKMPSSNISTVTRITTVFSKRSNVTRNSQELSVSPDTPGVGWQSQNSNIWDACQREVDAGPVENEDNEAGRMLPPDYDQVFRVPARPSVGPREDVKRVNLSV